MSFIIFIFHNRITTFERLSFQILIKINIYLVIFQRTEHQIVATYL